MRIQRGFAARPLIPVRRRLAAALTTAGAIGVLAVVGSGAPVATLGEAAAPNARPNVLVLETDDQAAQSLRVMPNVNSLIVERGTVFDNSGERELYDLQNDPFELVSRHDDPGYALVEAALAERLHQLESCAGDSCRVHQADPSPLG